MIFRTPLNLCCFAILLFLSSFLHPDTASLFAQTNSQGTRHKMMEFHFLSQKRYTNPHADITLFAQFLHENAGTSNPSNQTSVRIGGYWHGDTVIASDTLSIYKIRFAAPLTGNWSFRTTCTDSTNTRLHGQSGSIEVAPYTGTNHLLQHGFIKVAENKRTLAYADNTPFFYLGDTAWEITCRSTIDEVRSYISTRKSQGFNAVQIVAMSHLGLIEDGVVNRYGQGFFRRGTNFKIINPRYFDYLDSIVTMLNDSGMIAVIVPSWANGMTEANFRPDWFSVMLSNEAVLLMGKYAAARYAGNHVIWIVAGDATYSTQAQQQFWGQFAEQIHQMDGRQHLTTAHCQGHRGTFEFFPNSTSWLDMQTYQSSHSVPSTTPRDLARRGANGSPLKPLLNAEPVYEDIVTSFWSDNSSFDRRAVSENVRDAVYGSILTGALAGVSYGADGVWQWNSRNHPSTALRPRFHVDSAIRFPAARQMGIMKSIMENYRWYDFQSSQNLLWRADPVNAVVDVVRHSSVILAYFTPNTLNAAIDVGPLTGQRFFRWHNPVNGLHTAFQPVVVPSNFAPTFTPPTTTQDWVLAITNDTTVVTERVFISSTPGSPILPLHTTLRVYPHPVDNNGSCSVEFTMLSPSMIEFRLFTTKGEHIFTLPPQWYNTGNHVVTLNLQGLSTGVYGLHLLEATSRRIVQKSLLVKR